MTPHELETRTREFKKIVPNEITITRWEHSLRVAEIAKELALIHSKDEAELAYLAGIVHDITKQKTPEFHLTLFKESGQHDLEKLPSAAWHAYSAAIYLKSEYKLEHENVLSAVRNHTLGAETPGPLDLILYAADFLGSEYAEKNPLYPDWREQARKNIYLGVLCKAKNTMEDLIISGKPIHPRTVFTYNLAVSKSSDKV
ncbi:bis(5'-nucleosyl)-tetraphosphatase (symmetrical) YqeK [Leptospira kmetyi]|uniref:bis(5'-nucleosyl)-tetraphosphatase (symmetrical) n=1 Tax=Leptospira kmetyi TaxID=408139 RepID=A0A5F1XVD9_9LEPT|nr:bis(5'-nucleosyl)-tetraphosphatase (symmetrical) YqeK [Leptospira kmetyi]AYV55131.1 HD domain-containing protein [Leptospira kmetyi]EQA51884.1 hydrolase, HD family [Leptospira kmetyi serovar Malaysia str. Bejo-Iso9]PJZ30268.1 phosphohydrolase [Leptospira kmetyi]TGK19462.1 HD domain-containing protein [Leptospira kmetyi]TGK32836.1 HD domain-containing protein [Leptospira kmetyi]